MFWIKSFFEGLLDFFGFIWDIIEEYIVLIVLIISCIGLVLSLMALERLNKEENENWKEFKMRHNCEIVDKVKERFYPVVTVNPSNGQSTVGTIYEGAQVGWKCNDGITYYRGE